ncbi:hypothetical protein [Sediminicoccus sp. KRV36]|uniref:hypothetical protein n=1 Tax=Sediminicoccus sp. KRV36 TaxID=3133721 RepID=UPI0020108BA7|nr:hypothetical protein [Sediminicoccus rosea]UPY38102.1 hypothetical protein LHU95_05230 [Sediminicoccus rosea]
MLYLAAWLIFGWTASALGQSGGCTPTPGLEMRVTLLGCEVLRRGDLGGGLAWEVQQRSYDPPRAGSGPTSLRVMVVRQGGAAVAWTEPSFGHPARPERLVTPRGTLLRLPVRPATGSETSLDEVWLRREPLGDWVHLDARLWRDEAALRLAPGETLSPASRLEIRPLRATGQVARPGDRAGQPSGGAYTAWLDLGEDRLLLIGFSRR